MRCSTCTGHDRHGIRADRPDLVVGAEPGARHREVALRRHPVDLHVDELPDEQRRPRGAVSLAVHGSAAAEGTGNPHHDIDRTRLFVERGFRPIDVAAPCVAAVAVAGLNRRAHTPVPVAGDESPQIGDQRRVGIRQRDDDLDRVGRVEAAHTLPGRDKLSLVDRLVTDRAVEGGRDLGA